MSELGKYTDQFRLRVSDYTCYDTLTPYCVLDLCQDIAGKHAMTFGMGFDDLIAKNQIWVLVSVKYKLLKQPPLHSTVNVVTWPKQKGLVDFDREVQIMSKDGEVYVNYISKWVVINYETRQLIPAKRIDFAAYCPDDTNFPDKLIKIKDFDINGFEKYTYQTEFNDLDHNGHVNNARYAYMVLNAIKLKREEVIDEFQTDFIHEIHENSIVEIYYKKIDNYYLIKAFSDNKAIFVSKITLK